MITLTKVVHTRAATTGDKWPAFARQGVLTTDADLCSNSPASCLVLFDSVWCCVLIVFLKFFEFF